MEFLNITLRRRHLADRIRKSGDAWIILTRSEIPTKTTGEIFISHWLRTRCCELLHPIIPVQDAVGPLGARNGQCEIDCPPRFADDDCDCHSIRCWSFAQSSSCRISRFHQERLTLESLHPNFIEFSYIQWDTATDRTSEINFSYLSGKMLPSWWMNNTVWIVRVGIGLMLT